MKKDLPNSEKEKFSNFLAHSQFTALAHQTKKMSANRIAKEENKIKNLHSTEHNIFIKIKDNIATMITGKTGNES